MICKDRIFLQTIVVNWIIFTLKTAFIKQLSLFSNIFLPYYLQQIAKNSINLTLHFAILCQQIPIKNVLRTFYPFKSLFLRREKSVLS